MNSSNVTDPMAVKGTQHFIPVPPSNVQQRGAFSSLILNPNTSQHSIRYLLGTSDPGQAVVHTTPSSLQVLHPMPPSGVVKRRRRMSIASSQSSTSHLPTLYSPSEEISALWFDNRLGGLEDRERMRKGSHNLVEQRRRHHINNQLWRLQQQLPPDCFEEDGRITQGQVLKKAVEYISKQSPTTDLHDAWETLIASIIPLLELIQQLEQRAASLNIPVPKRSDELVSQMTRLLDLVEHTTRINSTTPVSRERRRLDSGVESCQPTEEDLNTLTTNQDSSNPLSSTGLLEGDTSNAEFPLNDMYSSLLADISSFDLEQATSDCLLETGGDFLESPKEILEMTTDDTSSGFNVPTASQSRQITGLMDTDDLTEWDLDDLLDM